MRTRPGNTLSGIVRGGMCTAIALGLTTGGALAHDDKGNDNHYDNSKAPHESPHKAEPPTGGHSSLAAAATNPIANLVQFQLQDQYNWDNHKSSGYSNEFLIQPVVPFKLPSKAVPLIVTRTTLPYVSTPDLGAPENRKHGFGDTTFLALAIPKINLKKTMIGVGISSVLPTGGDNDATGSGKWQLGPSFVYFNQQIPSIQWGALGWHTFTVGETSSGSDKKNVTVSSIQPILTKHWGEGWYASLQDVTWNYNHKSGKWSLPTGPRVGRVLKLGSQPVNLFGAVYYDPNSDGPTAKWTAKINLTLLFPE